MHNEYLKHLDASGLRSSTYKVATSTLSRHWVPFQRRLGRVPGVSDLQDFRTALAQNADLSPGYRNGILMRVRAMMAFAVDRKLWHGEYKKALAPFPIDKEAPRVLTRDELQQLARACVSAGTPTARVALCCLLTGARHKEILTLTPADITEHGVRISAERSKNRQGRLIPAPLLCGETQLLLRGPMAWKHRDWGKVRLPGLKVKDLRSTAATYFVNRGLLTPYQTAAIMGHTVAVAEKSYWSGVILGLTGDTTSEWLGVAEILKGWK